ALMLWNSRLQRVDVNAAHEKIFGFAREEVVGRGFEGLPYPEEFVRPRLDAVRRALQGEASRAELEAIRKDGRRIVTELRTIPFTQRGEAHVLQIARDITESRTAEARLRASEEQYRAIFNASADALVLRDADYRAVDVNPAYLAMSGFTRDEVLAAPRVLTQPDEALRRAHRALHDRAVAGETLRFETQGTRRDGSHFDAEVRGVPVLYRGAPHVLYATRDITERRAAEAERAALEAQLRQAQKMEAIGQLTGGIAHDFNNILTAVIGYLALGQERAAAGNDAKLVRQLEQAHLAAQRARDLIAQMLTFARRPGGEHRALAPGPLVRQSLQLLRSTLPSSMVLEASIGDDAALPAVQADAVQLEQVLFNLCINARDAMDGGGTIRVDLRAVRHPGLRCTSCGASVGAGPWVELGVADTGSGIAPDVMERMFEPFFSTKAVGRGSGMGLAMVHGIVHNHGGHVVVTSEPGHGSRFGVLWPLATADAVADAPAQPRGVAERRLAGRVMVVEDEPQVGELMAELLAGWGLQVVSMHDPLAAREWLEDRANTIDLLLTDHTMPQMTGLQLAQHATAARPTLPVLLYTGEPETEETAALHRHGVRALLRKPIEPQALRALLQRWLPPR
ncbi:MAG TPA: PAS domain S-box protein, partial [Burkholderiaceae bacterium]|nr:PAS domain S-box protein [Burkholderiaceae bacterium]